MNKVNFHGPILTVQLILTVLSSILWVNPSCSELQGAECSPSSPSWSRISTENQSNHSRKTKLLVNKGPTVSPWNLDCWLTCTTTMWNSSVMVAVKNNKHGFHLSSPNARRRICELSVTLVHLFGQLGMLASWRVISVQWAQLERQIQINTDPLCFTTGIWRIVKSLLILIF